MIEYNIILQCETDNEYLNEGFTVNTDYDEDELMDIIYEELRLCKDKIEDRIYELTNNKTD